MVGTRLKLIPFVSVEVGTSVFGEDYEFQQVTTGEISVAWLCYTDLHDEDILYTTWK